MPLAKTILVVDDDPLLREGVRAFLQKHGYKTIEAEDGQEARDIIDGHRPDLVILDMMMPRWGGFAVLEHFQNKADAPPFLMMTAHEGEKHKKYATQVGASGYMRKPFTMENLLDRVKRTLLSKPVSTPAQPESAEAPCIRCLCAGCGARIKASLQLKGQTRRCPGCRLPFVVQAAPPEDEGPALVRDDLD